MATHPERKPKPPKDPNQSLYDSYGGKDKYTAAKKERDSAVAKANKSEQPYVKSNEGLLAYLNTPVYGLYAKKLAAQQANNLALVASLNAEIEKTRQQIGKNNNQIFKYEDDKVKAEKAFEAKKVKKNNDKKGKDTKKPPKNPSNGIWHFNAPPVSTTSFLDLSELPSMLPGGSGNIDDAQNFWAKAQYGKGSFQMDRRVNTAEFVASAKKEAEKNGMKFDDTMYGFRFHYNPTTVNMSWNGVWGANPVYEMLANDPAIPISTNLFTGTVTFDIALNRIQDLAILDSNGKYKGDNPYPWNVDPAERKLIAEKGTMYDLEYLMRTLHGYAFFANYESALNGKTNDPGWLPVRPVELHLGNRLRYRVRVSGLEVVHKIFTEKMIPIWSVVSITCMRYWDSDQKPKDPKKK